MVNLTPLSANLLASKHDWANLELPYVSFVLVVLKVTYASTVVVFEESI